MSGGRTTRDQDEISRFDKWSDEWWDEYGKAKGLHAMNGLRVPLIRDGILHMSGGSCEASPRPLSGFSVLDVGCGGGLLSEPLARLGANVTGLDASAETIETARRHAQTDKRILGNLKYECETAEQHLASKEKHYDAVVVSEVAEHVDDLKLLVETCVKLTKVDGSLFFTTINKTYLAWLLAIIVAENVLNIVPKGTHSYDKLVPPEELMHLLKKAGCDIKLIHGMLYNPIMNKWSWMSDTSISYAVHAIRTKDP